jgi:hypothetical protein
MVRSGDFLRVPFFLRKNGHESIDSLYTLREFAFVALARSETTPRRTPPSQHAYEVLS